MSISFKNETNVEKFKQVSYFIFVKNRKVMNEILNSLTKKNKMQKMSLKIVFSVFSSVFIVWKNEKFRIVIDLKKINTKLYSDAYLLSKQNVIFFIFKWIWDFFFIDFIKKNFQQKIKSENKWKTTFVTFHRKFEWLTVSNMKFDNTFDFFQNRMKKVCKIYLWKFVLIYMNDIIVYSKNKNQHLTHFEKILNLFQKSNVTLTLKKCHFVYSNIKVLKHHVLKFELNTLKKKIKAIREFQFFKNLKKLNHEFDFFEYYKKFVEWYVWIEKSLHRLKIKKFRNAFTKNSVKLRWAIRTKLKEFINDKFESNSDSKKKKFESKSTNIENSTARNTFLILIFTKKCVRAWKRLKKKLIKTSILIFFNFFLSFILYTNDNKKKKLKSHFIKSKKMKLKNQFCFCFDFWMMSKSDTESRN